MRSRGILRLFWGMLFFAAVLASTDPASAANCVLYVRAATGVALYGAAGGWWNQAEGRYARGHEPAEKRVIRGGAHYLDPEFVRSASRAVRSPANQAYHLGFRVARAQSVP